MRKQWTGTSNFAKVSAALGVFAKKRFSFGVASDYMLNSKRFVYNIPYYTHYTKHGSLETLLRRPPIWAYDGRFGRVGPPAYGARTVGAGRRGGWPRAGRNTAARPQTCTSRSVSRTAGWRVARARAADASTQHRGADSVSPHFTVFSDVVSMILWCGVPCGPSFQREVNF